MASKNKSNVLLSGASGYVGGRLLKILENKDIRLRCLARIPSYLQEKVDLKTEVVKGDVLDKESLSQALYGINIAFYLIHSMSQNSGFQETDRNAASNFEIEDCLFASS